MASTPVNRVQSGVTPPKTAVSLATPMVNRVKSGVTAATGVTPPMRTPVAVNTYNADQAAKAAAAAAAAANSPTSVAAAKMAAEAAARQPISAADYFAANPTQVLNPNYNKDVNNGAPQYLNTGVQPNTDASGHVVDTNVYGDSNPAGSSSGTTPGATQTTQQQTQGGGTGDQSSSVVTSGTLNDLKAQLAAMGTDYYVDPVARQYMKPESIQAGRDAYNAKKDSLIAQINNTEYKLGKQSDAQNSMTSGLPSQSMASTGNTTPSGGMSTTGSSGLTTPGPLGGTDTTQGGNQTNDPTKGTAFDYSGTNLSYTPPNLPGVSPSYVQSMTTAMQPMFKSLQDLMGKAGASYLTKQDSYQKELDLSLGQRNAVWSSADFMLGNMTGIIQKMDTTARDRADMVQRTEIAAQTLADQRAQAQFARNEQLQRYQNNETERQLRTVSASYGLGGTGNGLAFMNLQIQQGVDSLSYIMTQRALASQDNANQIDKIISEWSQTGKEIDNTTMQNYQTAYSTYVGAKQAAAKDYLADAKAIFKEQRDATDALYKSYQDIEFKAGDMQSTANGKMMDAYTEILKFQGQNMGVWPKDTTDKINAIQGRMLQDTSLQSSLGSLRSYQSLSASVENFGKNQKDPAAKQAVLGFFNDILNGKAGISISQMGLNDKEQSILTRLGSAFQAGTILTPTEVQGMKNLAEKLQPVITGQVEDQLMKYVLDADSFNRTGNVAVPIQIENLLPPGVNLSTSQLSSYVKSSMGREFGTGTTGGGGGGGSSNLTPTSTLTDLFGVYAPATDNNSPINYAQNVAKDLGITADTPIGTLQGRIPEIARAIAKHEGFTDRSSRLAVVNNNPGNLKFIGQAGATRGEGGFAKFNSVAEGYQALIADLQHKITGGGTAIAAAPVTPAPSGIIPTANAAGINADLSSPAVNFVTPTIAPNVNYGTNPRSRPSWWPGQTEQEQTQSKVKSQIDPFGLLKGSIINAP